MPKTLDVHKPRPVSITSQEMPRGQRLSESIAIAAWFSDCMQFAESNSRNPPPHHVTEFPNGGVMTLFPPLKRRKKVLHVDRLHECVSCVLINLIGVTPANRLLRPIRETHSLPKLRVPYLF